MSTKEENLIRLAEAVKTGKANFKGRLIYAIIRKKMKKCEPYDCNLYDFDGLIKTV